MESPNDPNVAADALSLDPALSSRSKSAAIGYALLCVYYVVILLITLTKVPWATFDQVARDLSSRSDSILALVVFILANALLTISAWKLLSIYRWAFWCVVLGGIIAALYFLGVFALSVIAWPSPEIGSVGWWTIAISTVQLLIYGFCAASLLRVGLVTHRRRNEARMLAAGPLPTATL